jgi:processive 1,2-diacylglycerol beta-glucosyltransferase
LDLLVLHASCGGGHRAAAGALAKAFGTVAPAVEVDVEDALDHMSFPFRATYARAFEAVVTRAPRLYGALFRATANLDRRWWFRSLRSVWNGINDGGLRELLRERQPRAVVCTHFLPLEVALRAQRGSSFEGRVYSVVTDHVVHGLWRQPGAALTICAPGRSRYDLARASIEGPRVLATGIPIDPRWGLAHDARLAKARAGLDDLPVVLVLAGGTGLGPLVSVVREAGALLAGRANLVAVCGRNERLRAEAEREARRAGSHVRVLGFVDPLVELVRAADVVVTKPGALTTNECLAAGKAIVFYEAAPGQETENARFAVERGAALDGRTAAGAAASALRLVVDVSLRQQLERRARVISKPASALDAASAIAAHVEGRSVVSRPVTAPLARAASRRFTRIA